ncbi:MAG: hypothetical protein QM755_22490 [Luteolibacter sp.]
MLAAILLASFLLYAPSLANDFAWDDRHAAMGSGPTRQSLVASLHPLADYFAGNWWGDYAPGSQLYRPLTTLWFALRHALVGDDATIAHLLNVLLHTAGVLLAHALLRRLGFGFAAAAAGTALFALHAIHSEATANLVGGAELLALGFGLASALLTVRAAADARCWRFAGPYPLAAVCLFAAAASKESGLTWAAIGPLAVLAAHWRGALGRTPGRGDALAMALAAAVPAIVYLSLRAGMIAHLPAGAPEPVDLLANPLLDLPPLLRIASGLLAWGYGLLLTLAPFHLAVDYGPDQLPVVRDLASPWLAASAGVALASAAAIALALRHARRRPLVAFAVAHVVVTSVVTSHVPMPVFLHFGERTWTTPSFALAVAVAAAAAACRTRRARIAGATALAAWLVASVATAWPRNFVWADDATLILHEVEHTPRSARMHLAAGGLANQRGDVAAARRHFERAAELAPATPHAFLELAQLALRRRDLAAATALLARAEAVPEPERARHAARLQAARAALAAAATAAAASPAAAPAAPR